MKTEHFHQIFEKYSNIKFHENPSGGRQVVPCGRRDGQTDMTKITVVFFFSKILPTRQKAKQIRLIATKIVPVSRGELVLPVF